MLWIQAYPLKDSRVEEVSSVDLDSNASCRSWVVDSNLGSTFMLR